MTHKSNNQVCKFQSFSDGTYILSWNTCTQLIQEILRMSSHCSKDICFCDSSQSLQLVNKTKHSSKATTYTRKVQLHDVWCLKIPGCYQSPNRALNALISMQFLFLRWFTYQCLVGQFEAWLSELWQQSSLSSANIDIPSLPAWTIPPQNQGEMWGPLKMLAGSTKALT